MYSLYLLLSAVSATLYCYLIIWFITGWHQLKRFVPKTQPLQTGCTVIVPVYNGANSLEQTLISILNQRKKVPSFELIIIDDYSTDTSFELAQKYQKVYSQVKVLRNQDKKGKKQALLQAISAATGELIVTTDADCTHHPEWLYHIISYYQQHTPNMILGPVAIEGSNNWNEQFQQIEMVALNAATASTAALNHATMASAANMAFSKHAFNQLSDPLNQTYLSGDDMFLLHKLKAENPTGIHFIKNPNAVVTTAAQPNFKRFINQRVRWVSKSKGYTDNDTKFAAIVVAMASVLILAGFLLIPFKLRTWKPLSFLYTTKTIADVAFFWIISSFYPIKHKIKLIPLYQFWYSAYVSMTLIISLRTRKKW